MINKSQEADFAAQVRNECLDLASELKARAREAEHDDRPDRVEALNAAVESVEQLQRRLYADISDLLAERLDLASVKERMSNQGSGL